MAIQKGRNDLASIKVNKNFSFALGEDGKLIEQAYKETTLSGIEKVRGSWVGNRVGKIYSIEIPGLNKENLRISLEDNLCFVTYESSFIFPPGFEKVELTKEQRSNMESQGMERSNHTAFRIPLIKLDQATSAL